MRRGIRGGEPAQRAAGRWAVGHDPLYRVRSGGHSAIFWTSDAPAVLVAPSATSSSRATVQRAPATTFAGSTVIRACVDDPVACPLQAQARVDVVPDLRGTWFGTGSFNAAGCSDPEDDGVYPIGDWLASFTQTVDPANAPVSNLTAALSGSGIGVRNVGSLSGTLNASQISAAASYVGGGAGGNVTFSGPFEAPAVGFEALVLSFAYQDTFGDTCRGTGQVTFRRNPP